MSQKYCWTCPAVLIHYRHMANGDTKATPNKEQQHMYMNKATEYAISRLIFNIEQAVQDDDSERRWEAYDALRELGIDHMFHQMPEKVQMEGIHLYWKARTAVSK